VAHFGIAQGDGAKETTLSERHCHAQKAILAYLKQHDTATLRALTETLVDDGRGNRYADTVGGESVIPRRLYADGRFGKRSRGKAVQYVMADGESTGDDWSEYAPQPRPKELAAMLAQTLADLGQAGAGISEKEYEAAVRTLRGLAETAPEKGLYPVASR
jgi:hypothetical protein